MTSPGSTGHARALRDLTVDECLRLLSSCYVGRLAYLVEGKPTIVPLNYRLHEGSIVFRVDAGTTLDALHSSRTVAFEVDEVDPDYHHGWSVVVHGKAEEIADPATLEVMRELPLRPWAPGTRSHYVRILSSAISGRRIA